MYGRASASVSRLAGTQSHSGQESRATNDLGGLWSYLVGRTWNLAISNLAVLRVWRRTACFLDGLENNLSQIRNLLSVSMLRDMSLSYCPASALRNAGTIYYGFGCSASKNGTKCSKKLVARRSNAP